MRREVDPDVYCPQAALIDEETNRRAEARLARYRARHEAEKLHRRQMTAAAQQRRQRAWMAALALAGAAWLWYRLYVRKRRGARKGTIGGHFPRDLFLDEDDVDVTQEELEQLFREAAKAARSFPGGMLDQRDQLMLYGLYKQAKEGDLHGAAPSKLNVVAHAKYNSWGKFKGLPKRFAMKKYCEVVYHFSKGGKSAYSDARGADKNDDVHYHGDDNPQRDVDEDGCPIHQDGEDDGGGSLMSGLGVRQSTLAGTPDDAKPRNTAAATSTPEVALREAAMANDARALAEIMGGACDVDAADEQGQTALHFAADRGSFDCLKLLVEGGANVNAADCDGIGVLQTALSAGSDVGPVRTLLEAGADPDARDDDGDSPRAWAEEEGDDDLRALFALFPER